MKKIENNCVKKNGKKTAHIYRVFFLTGPPDFQYQNEKQVAANQD